MTRLTRISITIGFGLLASIPAAMPALAQSTAAGTGIVTGIVRNGDTGKPSAYANLMLMGTTWGCMSRADGSFRITDVPAGRYKLRVMQLACRSTTLDSVMVEPGRTTRVDVSIDPLWPESEVPKRSIVGTKTDATRDDLSCEIVPVGAPFHVGDAPKFRVVIHNVGEKSFYLVRAGRGADYGLRYPQARLKVEGPGRVDSLPVLLDPKVSPVGFDEFVRVEPGGAFEPLGTYTSNKPFDRPGRYTVTFHYSTDAIDYAKWMDSRSRRPVLPEVLSRLSQVPRVDIEASIAVDGAP